MIKEKVLAYLLTMKEGRDDSGATAVEYGLLIALVTLVLLGALMMTEDPVNSLLNKAVALLEL